jgi:nucleoid DNA-binding protein
MGKLTKEQHKEILTKYKLDNSKANIAKICKEYNITKQTIFNIAKSDISKEVEKSITESKDNFTKRCNEIIKLTMDRIENEILNGDKVTLSQLSTTLGILYDKSRLENNLSTSNNEVKISIKIEK